MSLATPAEVMQRLEEIERDIAARQNDYEDSALKWFRAKRDREKAWAEAFVAAEGTVEQRRAFATLQSSHVGIDAEAAYEAHKAVMRTLDTRASIGQSILKAQGRS